jgi:S-ribosylhomocysteine lyase LuxS involved in autoinducer biosynthesis
MVFEKQSIEGKQVLPIQLRTGFYMAQLQTEKGVSVVKVVVE